MRKVVSVAAVVLLVVSAAGCGGDEGIGVEGAWARPSPAMANAGAVYMVITAAEDDALVSASVDPAIAGTVEIHETVAAEDVGDGGAVEEGMSAMTMQQVDAVDLPAGKAVAFEPGGYHIMLLDLPTPLETGQTFDVTLTFSGGDTMTVPVEVREEAP